jgi:H+-transporting ATPase
MASILRAEPSAPAGDRSTGMGGASPAEPLAANAAAAGLTSIEARQRREKFGPNAVAEHTPARWRMIFAKFWSPVPWMLEAAIFLQLWLGQYFEAGLIAGLLIFNATLGTVQEGRASAALAALKKRLALTALARRDGARIRVPASELVPGGVISLSLGALVPVDAILLSGCSKSHRAYRTLRRESRILIEINEKSPH